MATSIEIILVPTLMILLGMFLKHINFLKSTDSILLNKIVLNISLPALLFINLSTAKINPNVGLLPITATLIVIITAVLAYVYSKVQSYSKKATWTIIMASSMMNTAFIGYPVIMGVLGNDGFVASIFYDMVIALAFVVYAMILTGVFGGSKKQVLKDGLSFMPLWAAIFGLLFNVFNVHVGYVLESSLNYLGQATIALIMLSVGLKLDVLSLKANIKDSAFILFLQLILAPLIVMLAYNLMGVEGLIYKVGVLDTAMPIAMNCLVLSITYDLDSQLMASVIFLSTILCVFTLTIFASII